MIQTSHYIYERLTDGQKRGGRGGGGGRPDTRAPYVGYEETKKTNELFERYYNELNIVPDPAERETFWAAMHRELPNSWRFTGSKGYMQIWYYLNTS